MTLEDVGRRWLGDLGQNLAAVANELDTYFDTPSVLISTAFVVHLPSYIGAFCEFAIRAEKTDSQIYV